MSHMIELREIAPGITGSFVASRDNAWHQLGLVMDRDLTVAEALDLLDVGEVQKLPISGTITGPDGFPYEVTFPDRMGTFRIRNGGAEVTPLGIVSNTYPVWGEREGFAFLQHVVADAGAVVTAAGLLQDGKRSFCCLKLPQTVVVGGVDEVQAFIFCYTSHDGSVSYIAAVTPVRVVCQNTVTMALQGAQRKYVQKHHRGAVLDVEEARNAMGITEGYLGAFAAYANELMARKVDTATFEKIVRKAWGGKVERPNPTPQAVGHFAKRLELAMDLWTGSKTNEAVTGTAWGALQVGIEVLDWFTPVRDLDRKMDQKGPEAQTRRLARNLQGDNETEKVAFQQIVAALTA